VKGTGTNLHVVGLKQCAALPVPVILQGEDQPLEGCRSFRHVASLPLRGYGSGEYSEKCCCMMCLGAAGYLPDADTVYYG
jgi:hypothetical protein